MLKFFLDVLAGNFFSNGSFAGKTTFSKIVALNVLEGRIRYEGDKSLLNLSPDFQSQLLSGICAVSTRKLADGKNKDKYFIVALISNTALKRIKGYNF